MGFLFGIGSRECRFGVECGREEEDITEDDKQKALSMLSALGCDCAFLPLFLFVGLLLLLLWCLLQLKRLSLFSLVGRMRQRRRRQR
jgi:hypothetical protein